MTQTGLLEALQQLPSEGEASFGPSVREFLSTEMPTYEALAAIYEDGQIAQDLRFGAFYAAQVKRWRAKDFAEHREATNRWEATFGNHPMFSFMLAEYFVTLAGDEDTLVAAEHYARAAASALPTVPGVLHLVAEIVAERVERSSPAAPEILVLDAERFVAQAIGITEGRYPKYFATRARLLLARRQYTEAQREVQRAIELEPSTSPEYALRVGEYQLLKARAQLSLQADQIEAEQRRAMDEIRSRYEQASEEFRSSRRESLQLLGLLAAVIAFIVTATQVAVAVPARDGAGLMITITGALALLLVALRLTSQPPTLGSLYATLCGFVLVGTGLSLLTWWA